MQKYRDIDADSGVTAFEIGPSQIDIQFRKGGTYRYTVESAGTLRLARMIELAQAGEGLNAYINKNKPKYAAKWG